jgi:hypothetical protein
MKLYVFTSGALNLDKSIIQNGSSGKVQIPAEFYSIRHPKGDVLFDCGNNDKIIADPDYGGPFAKALDPGRSPDIAIDAQLAKINVKPSDIKYVMLGHFHVDHAGNIGKFLDSTFVYQRDEIKNAFCRPSVSPRSSSRKISPCCAMASAAACRRNTKPSSLRAISTCLVITASSRSRKLIWAGSSARSLSGLPRSTRCRQAMDSETMSRWEDYSVSAQTSATLIGEPVSIAAVS